jgi:hypothetical protein
MAEDTKQPEAARTGTRGTSYPALSLQEAINRAQQFYNAEKRSAAPLSAAAEHWGYTAKSSATRLAVAALIHYGLLEDFGSKDSRTIKLTNLALDILLDTPESPKRLAALQKAARSPKIIADLLAQWPPDSLPSDSTLKYYLIREKGFNDDAVDGFIKDFRASVAFAKLNVPANNPVEPEEKPAPTVTPKVGDYVQWEVGGVLRLPEPKRITGIAETGDFVFIEGSLSGVPLKEVTVVQTPSGATSDVSAGTVAPLKPPAVGVRQDVFTLDEGQVVLQFPAKMSAASFEDFESWIQLQLRKIKRGIDQ